MSASQKRWRDMSYKSKSPPRREEPAVCKTPRQKQIPRRPKAASPRNDNVKKVADILCISPRIEPRPATTFAARDARRPYGGYKSPPAKIQTPHVSQPKTLAGHELQRPRMRASGVKTHE